ncbi:membrane-spanning 4-domains subfamily A member 8-like [Ochotona curzoniae]|uniref:membrane-spanning 4-domains subfamily A member 8-like n=1 Tax=Ochotona curzoniae TaxID=130825 RepID=UPI001B34BA73|nr:membrane-spanning 4-domains subfamily A member 8-like [Ochotona curzoniae]
MNSMTSAGPMANSVFVVASHKSYPMIPGVTSQVPLSPDNQPQIHLVPANSVGSMSTVNESPARKPLKEGKTLGAVQILIGLAHIGLGGIMATIISEFYIPISFYGGFPFWGGSWFIISGSVSVAAENQPKSSCLLNGSVGLNIFSAICSAVGILLFITDLSISSTYKIPNYYVPIEIWSVNPGMAISSMLLIFCTLEFCIACTSSHFGCQLVCCQHNNVGTVIPNVYATNPVAIPEPVCSLDLSQKAEKR